MRYVQLPGICRLIIALSLVGCADISKGLGRMERAMRTPGEKLVATPEATAKDYPCDTSTGQRLELLEVDLKPDKLSPGEEISHRIRYALCSPDGATNASGSITRNVLYSGQSVLNDRVAYEFLPGTWTVDVFVQLPEEMANGYYTVQTILEANGHTIANQSRFVVESN